MRVRYLRFAGSYAAYGLHLWPSNGMDTARMPASVTLEQWAAPVAFSAMPGYAAPSAAAAEVVFDVPVLDPQGDATVYTAKPDTRSASTRDARAFWPNKQLIQWPRVDGGGVVKLYHSATGQTAAPLGGNVAGAAANATDLGVTISAGKTRFKL